MLEIKYEVLVCSWAPCELRPCRAAACRTLDSPILACQPAARSRPHHTHLPI